MMCRCLRRISITKPEKEKRGRRLGNVEEKGEKWKDLTKIGYEPDACNSFIEVSQPIRKEEDNHKHNHLYHKDTLIALSGY